MIVLSKPVQCIIITQCWEHRHQHMPAILTVQHSH